MNPRRGFSRVPWLAYSPLVLALSLFNSAPAQNPPEPAQQNQQPANAPQPAQQSAPVPTESQPTQQTGSAPAAPSPQSSKTATKHQDSDTGNPQSGEITEEQLKQMLVGKTFYLRGGYLDDSLTFNEHGKLAGHSPVGSYTLSMVEIEKVGLSKHKVELEAVRYGLHFSNQLAFEDPRTAFDKVRITPKKKTLRITIDRESVVKPKKEKEEKKGKERKGKPSTPVSVSAKPGASAPAATQSAAPQPAAGQQAETTEEEPDTDQAKAEIAAAKPEERPADPDSVTTTTSPAHATMVLKQAIDNMFAPGLDDRMMNAMPDFWKLYYQAVAEKKDYRPSDPAVMSQSKVDKKARLLSNFVPESNQFAQDRGVAGMAMYHAVIGPDGTPGEIAVARPIGFGLDENAVKAIRAAKFDPAEKDGKPVPVLLDLVVQFRIYSNRTNVTAPAQDTSKPDEPVLPGPYTLQQQQAERQAQSEQSQPQQPDQTQPQPSQPDPAQQQSQPPSQSQPAQPQQPQL